MYITPIIPGEHRYPTITPFTIADGQTYLNTLEHLVKMMKDIIDNVNENNEELYMYVVGVLNTKINEINDALDNQEASVDQKINALETLVNETDTELRNYVDTTDTELRSDIADAVTQVINSSIEVQDPVVAQLVDDPGSDTRAQLNATFADKDTQTTVESGRLSETQLNATFVRGRATQDDVQLGPELVTSTGWTLGTGWAGSFEVGFTHTPGNTEDLTWTPGFDPSEGENYYMVQWQVSAPGSDQFTRSDFSVFFGGQHASIIYEGLGESAPYSRAIRAVDGSPLLFVPLSTFMGRIHSVSVRRILTPTVATSVWRGSGGDARTELRTGGLDNLFLGLNAGRYVATANNPAKYNVIVGGESFEESGSGFFNVGVGYRVLRKLQNGSRQAVLGYRAFENLIDGDRNVGVGPFAGNALIDGSRNVLLGTDVYYQAEHGNDNIMLGYLAGHAAENLDVNIAMGRYAMGSANGAEQNIAVGTMALRFGTGEHNIMLGYQAGRDSTGNFGIGIGQGALRSTSNNNGIAIGAEAFRESNGAAITGVGFRAGRYWAGDFNSVFGSEALAGVLGGAGGERNTVIGYRAGELLESGDRNTLVGSRAGHSLVNGSDNILIGNNVNTTPAASGSSMLNIGDLLRGDLSSGRLGIGMWGATARLHLPAGQAGAGSAPFKLTSGTLLTTPENGAIEFAGNKLYFTVGGTRREIAFV